MLTLCLRSWQWQRGCRKSWQNFDNHMQKSPWWCSLWCRNSWAVSFDIFLILRWTPSKHQHIKVDKKIDDPVRFSLIFQMLSIWVIKRGKKFSVCGQFCSGIFWHGPYPLTLWDCPTFQSYQNCCHFSWLFKSQERKESKLIPRKAVYYSIYSFAAASIRGCSLSLHANDEVSIAVVGVSTHAHAESDMLEVIIDTLSPRSNALQ